MENVDRITLSEVMSTASWYAPRCAVSSPAATPERHRCPRGPEWHLPLQHGYLYSRHLQRAKTPYFPEKKCPTANGGSRGYTRAGGWSRPSDFTWGKFKLNEWKFCLIARSDLQYVENTHPLLPLQRSASGHCLETASMNCGMFADSRLLMENVSSAPFHVRN